MRDHRAGLLPWAIRVLVAILATGTAVPGAAQTDITACRISGMVRDANGNGLPGVTVEAVNQETGLRVRSVSDQRGFYVLLDLPTGTYSLVAARQGFATVERPDVPLLVSAVPAVDFTVLPGPASATVTIDSAAPLVEVARTAISTTMQPEHVVKLPLFNRDYKWLVALAPDVLYSSAINPAISGQRAINTNVTVDGADFNNAFFGGTSGNALGGAPMALSQESVKELSVITNGAPIELGRSAGGFVNVVTRSGTNRFRGSAFVYGQPNSFVGAQADGKDLPTQDKWQYGVSLSGPIVKDRLFFFTSVDNQKRDMDINVDARVTSLDPAFLAKYPFFKSEPAYTTTQDGRALFGRLDVLASPRHRFTLRGNYSDYTGENGTIESSYNSSGHNGNEQEWARDYVASYSGVLGAALLNDASLQYVIEASPRDNVPSTDPYPEFAIRAGGGYGGVSFLPVVARQTRTQVSDTLTYLAGGHVIKAGLDLNWTGMEQVFKGNWRGVYIFNSEADLYAGRWVQFRQFLPMRPGDTVDDAGRYDGTQKETALFLQDQWSVSPTVTLSAGVRWERLDNPDDPVLDYERPGPGGAFPLDGTIPDTDNEWSPRLGLAWSPGSSGKAVVRVAAGRFWSRTPAILLAQLYTSNGVQGQQYVATSKSFPCAPGYGTAFDPTVRAPVTSCGLQAPPGVFVIDKDFANPRTDRITLGGDLELAKNTLLSLDVTWAETMHLERLTDINLAYAHNPDGSLKLSPINGQPEFLGTGPGARPNPRYGRITMITSDARSEYWGIAAALQRRFADGLAALLSVTYAWDRDNDSNERVYSTIFAEDPYRFREEEWGYSARDIRWKIGLAALWDTPLWGLSLSGTFRYYSGYVFNATTTTDANKDGNFTDRPTVNGEHFGRNTFRGPEHYFLHLRLAKQLALGPGRLALYAECFNCTNHENAGIASTIWGDGQTPAATFGHATVMTTYVRTFQLALRYDF